MPPDLPPLDPAKLIARQIVSNDLYTYNSLNSFSFGSVQPAPSSRQVNPLSPFPDDDDFPPADITPRPSVSGYQPPQSLAAVYPRGANTASHRTFGSSSASLTSLSSNPSPTNSRTASRASTMQTSANDDTTTDSDDDHRHPIPPHLLSPSRTQRLHLSQPPRLPAPNMEFSSDEDYDDSEYDDDDYVNYNPDIEISSAMYEGSLTHSHTDWDRDRVIFGSGNGSSAPHRSIASTSALAFNPSERRGSLPIPIPGIPTLSPDAVPVDSFFPARDREDSVATLRRPSRSLDDDLRLLSLASASNAAGGGGGGNANSITGAVQTAPVSVPESDGDWRSLMERATARGKGKAREMPSDGASPAPSASTTLGGSMNIMDGFDLDWGNMRGGITALDQSEVADIVRSSPTTAAVSTGRHNTFARRPSAPRWLPSWGGLHSGHTNNGAEEPEGDDVNGRRPSSATVASLYGFGGDSFGRAVGKWGGDGYKAQRKDWSFRKEKAEKGEAAEAGAGFLSPRGSMVSDRTGEYIGGEPIASRDVKKDREKKTKSPSTPWRGMQLNEQEVWNNDLVGRFKVDRKVAKPTDPAKGAQQRLVVHHFRGPYSRNMQPHNGPPVTIHKHSKAVAFSISRHYKVRMPGMREGNGSGMRGNLQGSVRSGSGLDGMGGHHSRMGMAAATREAGGVGAMHPTKKSSGMILLAPRRVQEAFTSTTTTRKLESHGLLDETRAGANGGASTSSLNARERERRREKEKEKERDRKKREKEEAKSAKARRKELEKGRKADDRGGDSSASGKLTDSQSSSAGSTPGITSQSAASSGGLRRAFPPASSLPPPPMSAPSIIMHAYPSVPPPPPPPLSSGAPPLEFGHPFSPTEGRTVSRTSSRASRRRPRRRRDPLDTGDENEDDYDSASDVPPVRTPHSEAYGTIDANLIEQLRPRHERGHISDLDTSAGFLKRFIRSRGGLSAGSGAGATMPEPYYDPPWLVLASRGKQEQQQRVVDNLNTSFKDVGLLPSNHKDKPRTSASSPSHAQRSQHHQQQQRRKTRSETGMGSGSLVDIFEEVPPDSLYMLLPLWPGDTDPVSERKMSRPFVRPNVPSEQRLYLLVYYKPEGADAQQGKGGKGESGEGSKKKSRGSPTSSYDSVSKREDRSILLTSFHVSARLVSYRDLQGSGVRVPDEGLTVTGPLEAAYESMPTAAAIQEEGSADWVIGQYYSREAGIEFYPEGLAKIGVCAVSQPLRTMMDYKEEAPIKDPVVELTPIGRAVLEMAWLGCMALTSFGPGT